MHRVLREINWAAQTAQCMLAASHLPYTYQCSLAALHFATPLWVASCRACASSTLLHLFKTLRSRGVRHVQVAKSLVLEPEDTVYVAHCFPASGAVRGAMLAYPH